MQTPPPTYAQYPRYRAPEVRFDLIGEAFQLFSQKPVPYIVASLPTLAVTIVSNLIGIGVQFMPDNQSLSSLGAILGVQLFIGVLAFFLYAWQLGGMVAMGVKHSRGEEIKAADAFTYKGFGSVFAALFGISILTFIGTMLCCLPGLIAYGTLFLSIPLVVVGGYKGFDAVGKSWDTLKAHLWPATGFGFVTYLIYGVASTTCIGIVVGLPIMGIAMMLMYRDFFDQPGQFGAIGQASEPGR